MNIGTVPFSRNQNTNGRGMIYEGLYWHLNWVLKLNWIIWNESVLTFFVWKQNLYLYKTELFKLELFD